MTQRTNRRDFLKAGAAMGVGFWVAGGIQAAESKSANEKLNIASVGAGGRAASDIDACSSENIVALCDVDERRAGGMFGKHPNAKKFTDFRQMLDKMDKEIEAVIVATPDHLHAMAAGMAIKMGKHVYVEKPLTHDVWEARRLKELANEHKVATQMGNQGTAGGGLRREVETVQSGGIGDVLEAHVWSNRPIWPQGMKDRPPKEDVPAGLDWDLWLGPTAFREYNHAYLPFVWRGWWDFGTGALGDMACHTMNMPFWGLELQYPAAFEAHVPYISPESPPQWSKITFDFPERKGRRGQLPAVSLTWYDGTRTGLPKELRQFEEILAKYGVTKPDGSGSLLVGSKGVLYSPGDYGGAHKLLPEEFAKEYKRPEPWLPNSPGHHREWINACKGGPPAMSNFNYSAYLAEIILLGNLAMRVPGKVEWDGPKMTSTNSPEANKYVRREYRKGYDL
jgi:predicted dehydrogenase